MIGLSFQSVLFWIRLLNLADPLSAHRWPGQTGSPAQRADVALVAPELRPGQREAERKDNGGQNRGELPRPVVSKRRGSVALLGHRGFVALLFQLRGRRRGP